MRSLRLPTVFVRFVVPLAVSILILPGVADAERSVLGDVYGAWTKARGPYRVAGEIAVRTGDTLTIGPGVDVIFDADVPFIVEGTIVVAGAKGDSVRFRPRSAGRSWQGIRIVGDGSRSVAYARFEGVRKIGYSGRAIEVGGGRIAISHSLFVNNTADYGAGITITGSAIGTISSCRFVGNSALDDGGALNVSRASVSVDSCVFLNNRASSGGAVMFYGASGFVITNSLFRGNGTHSGSGGAIQIGTLGSSAFTVHLENLVVDSNSSVHDGGGIAVLSSSDACATMIRRCVVTRNRADGGNGGGISSEMSTAGTIRVDRCSIVGNRAPYGGGGIHVGRGNDLKLTNSIVYGNRTGPTVSPANLDWNSGAAITYVSHVVLPDSFPGYGLESDLPFSTALRTDPLLVNAARGDYRLRPDSPCIDAGIPSDFPDPDGTRADIGAIPFVQGGPYAVYAPFLNGRPGVVVLAPIAATGKDIISADLAFRIDTSIARPAEPFIRSTALPRDATIAWRLDGDVVAVSIEVDSARAIDLVREPLFTLAFAMDERATRGATSPIAWLPYPATRLNEERASLGGGEIAVPPFIYGDVDDDGAITAQDASLILRYCATLVEAIDTVHADVTGAGGVSGYDAAHVLRKVADADYPFPARGEPARSAFEAMPALYWMRAGSRWNLVVSDATGIGACDLVLRLPTASPATATDAEPMAFRQSGDIIRISLVRPAGMPGNVLVSILGVDADVAPVVVEALLNETRATNLPRKFALYQSMPNPFNPRTTIRFDLPAPGPARLAVYDVNGRLVRTLTDRMMTAGAHEAIWDGRDAAGRQVASGVYVYRLVATDGALVRRMVLVR